VLAGLSAASLVLGATVRDDYTQSVAIEIGAAVVLFLALAQVAPTQVGRKATITLVASGVTMLGIAYWETGFWRGLWIELGAGTGLFIALERLAAARLARARRLHDRLRRLMERERERQAEERRREVEQEPSPMIDLWYEQLRFFEDDE
jgi:hypothetical protein